MRDTNNDEGNTSLYLADVGQAGEYRETRGAMEPTFVTRAILAELKSHQGRKRRIAVAKRRRKVVKSTRNP